MRKKKLTVAMDETLSFLHEIASADHVGPIIRRKARRLIALFDSARNLGSSPKLAPGDGGKIVSLVDRERAEGQSWENAVSNVAEQFGISPRQVERLYKRVSQQSI
jgi:hypothetical protein